MHRLAVFFALAAACGGSHNVGPVAGAHEAFERHYDVTVVEAHAALLEVLKEKYGGIVEDDGVHVIASAACRDTDGDPCAMFPRNPSAVGMRNRKEPLDVGPLSGQVAGYGGPSETTGHYWFQIYAGVAGADGDIQIQLGGHAKDFKEHEFAIGAPGSPGWMPHEVDEIRVAVDRELARR
jgi:hypothetical protein